MKPLIERPRTFALLAVPVIAAGGWLALVASHDPAGAFGESSAAWTQALMSVGAILAAIFIDQGASRRDRRERQAAADRARAARLRAISACATMLDNAAKAVAERTPKRGLRFEGLAVDALASGSQMIGHYLARGSDDEPILVWFLSAAAGEVAAAEAAISAARLSTAADQRALERRLRAHAQGLREMLDEHAAGLFEV